MEFLSLGRATGSFLAALAAGLALSGCAGMGGNAACSSRFPQGMTGSIPMTTCVVFNQWSSDWDLDRRTRVANADAAYLGQSLQRLAQANPNGPQFQVQLGERCYMPAGGILLHVIVDGEVHREDYGIVEGMAGKLWAKAYPQSAQYGRLFNFNTQAYDYAENPDNMPAMFDEVASRYYQFIADGWTCGGAR